MSEILRLTGWREIEARWYIQRRADAVRSRNLIAELAIGECIRDLMRLEACQ